MSSASEVVVSQKNIDFFDTILNDNLNKAVNVGISYGLIADFDSFIDVIATLSDVDMEDFYQNWADCDEISDEILGGMNIVNKSSTSLEEDLSEDVVGLDDSLIPIISDIADVQFLFDDYSLECSSI